jgi:hypothetical protein
MILYIERDIFFDNQCRDIYLCDNDLDNEYLLFLSIDGCSCKKQQAILCKYNHDLCEERCLAENCLFIKQKCQSNEMFINNNPANIVLLDKNELETNSEIIYICHENNVPKPIIEHLKKKLNNVNQSSINRV